jgi:energy-coupling factor transporter transmembrane protein EcfT
MAKPRKPTPLAMARFFLSVRNYRQALRELWNSLWAWVPILFIAALVCSFGYGAMTEGKYILALILYAVGAVAVGAKAIHDYRTHPLRRQLNVIIVSVTVIILACLIWWTAYENSKARQKLQEQSRQFDQQNQKLDETNKKLDETARKLDEITKLLKEQNPQATPETLLKKYSHGYAIVKLNQTSSPIPYDSRLLEGWKINWDVAGVKNIGSGKVEVRLPDFTAPGNISFSGTVVVLNNIPNAHNPGLIVVGNVEVTTEILAVASDGIVAVIGFNTYPGGSV